MAKDSIWNDNLVNQLKDLYLSQDLTTVNIAKELGFTKNAIIGKIHRLKLNALKDANKVVKDEIKIVVKKESTKPAKEFKEKTVVTFKSDKDVKTIVDIAKKSNTITNKIDLPFVVEEETTNIRVEKANITHKSVSNFTTFENNISSDFFSSSASSPNAEHMHAERGKYKLSEIEFNMCVWPFGHDDFTFCGDKSVVGRSYCQAHLDLVYFVTKKAPKKKYADLEEEGLADVEEIEDDEEEVEIENIE
jgi:hypothetical protein